jgi:hypothetical protein
MHAVSLTPHAQKIFEQFRNVKIVSKTAVVCKMRCQWHRMHDACGIIDTACTVHAVSLTPHAKYDTACTIDERLERPWQPLKGISVKNIYVPELSYPTTKKFINGLPIKKFSCMRCHWHRMHDFCVRKSIITRRIRSRIQKGFSPWIRGPGGIVWWKKPRVENLVTLSL